MCVGVIGGYVFLWSFKVVFVLWVCNMFGFDWWVF